MKIDRLVSILMILLDQRRVSAQELADRFEVSPRTIYRDIDAINLAGIPVRSTSGVGGGFEIMPTYKLDRNVFSSNDLSAILTGLTGLSNLIRGDELANALAKVRSFIPAEQAKDIEGKTNQIHIDFSPWIGNRTIQPNLERIQTAMQESRLVSFEYADRYGTKSARIAEPYRLILKGSHWYWQGYCHTRNDFRLFKLTRTANLQLLETLFTPRNAPTPQLDTTELVAAMQTTIVLRIHKSVLDRVLDFCTQDDISPDGDEHYLVRFPFFENDYYYSILFSFGVNCECLEPPHVRAEMKRISREIAAIYERE